MSKIRQSNALKIITALITLSVLSGTIGFMTEIKAASLTEASDTISDSAPDATGVTHTFDFTINLDIPAGGNILITFDSSFDLSGVASGDVTCPAGSSFSATTSQTVECTNAGQISATSALQFIVADVTSPSKSNATGVADSYTFAIQTRDSGDAEVENAEVMVAIIETVTMSATVAAILDFRISGLGSGVSINGSTTNVVTTTTTIPFGTVTPGAANIKIGGQRLSVTTNADYGFVVTVEQDGNLTSAASSDIDSFLDGTPQTTPATWVSPAGTLGTEDTYGHMGFTSNDANLSSDSGSYPDFSGGLYGGFNGTSPFVVFAHTGPSDGSTQNMGLASVAYRVELSALQEAGDYVSVLTYICTPTY
jgi:hypothetical protein